MSLPVNVTYAISTLQDGSMSIGVSDEQRLENRRRFLARNGMTTEQAVLVRLAYEGENYRRYFTVSSDQAGDGVVRSSTITADALFTTCKDLTLLLPAADCIGAVLYDPIHQVLGVSHLGRHNLAQKGGSKTIEYMMNDFGSNPADIRIWLSPAAGQGNYPLYDFDNRSLIEVTYEQLLAAGVQPKNIETDGRDTTIDDSLFSHSEFSKGKRTSDGRQMVIAMMRP